MATAAVAAKKAEIRDFNFTWVGQDRGGKTVRGEIRATGEAQVNALLRRQGIKVQEIKKQKRARGGKITEKDITLFTRQLATMVDAGLPLVSALTALYEQTDPKKQSGLRRVIGEVSAQV